MTNLHDLKAEVSKMNYEQFIQEVVKRGIEAVKRDYKLPERKAIRKGSIAGFKACLGKNPIQLSNLLKNAHAKTRKLMLEDRKNPDKYLEATGFEFEVEWVCNCVSCLLYNEKKPTIVPPTARAMIFTSKIVGVKGDKR